MSYQRIMKRIDRSNMAAGAVALLVALSAAACDFDVSNPGPVEDAFLENQSAHQAMANGAMVSLADALTNVAYTTGAVTREIFPAGSTSAFGISASQQQGILRFDDEHISWTSHQRARSVAQNAIARFEENENVTMTGYRPAAEAALWAGYANRLLGDSFCEAVIDGGPIVNRTAFYDAAETWFTRTMELATGSELENVAMAARAGRASVRANVGNWAGAVADAELVPDGFVFNMAYTTQQSTQYNRIYWATANQPYRAHTVWNTFYEDYYADSGDPRTPWGEDPDNPLGDAAVGVLDGERAPWLFQLKHNRQDSPIRLSSGWEMRLTQAEALLVAGNWADAMPLINMHRVELGLDPWAAASLDEAWTMYKRERGIELWLEARRITDLRRWADNNAPGDLHPRETPGDPASYLVANQDLCIPIPKAEYETNPNLTLPG
jgi:starch-binding outer membrane protein, SusD/RagB family